MMNAFIRPRRAGRHRRASRRGAWPSALCQPLEPRLLLAAQPALTMALLPNETQNSNISFSDLWHLQNTGQNIQGQAGTAGADINAPAAWNLSTGSRSVVVAVLDTGIDLNHPDLAANIYTKPADIYTGLTNDIHGWNFVDNNNSVQDNDVAGHGTLVSGVIGAVGNNNRGVVGVNWNVSVLPVKILNTSGSTTDGNIVAGINYVIGLKQAGVDVVAINASFASPSAYDPSEGLSSAVVNAIGRAGDNGILFVNAAGNESTNINILNALPGWSSLTNVITVAATDNRDQLASFSNYGNQVVQLGAPGVNITTTYPGGLYYYASGTSLAAPMVSGAVGLLAALAPAATAAQIKNAILSSVDPDPSLVGKTVTGGRLDIYKAMETLIGNVAPFGSFDVATSGQLAGWAYDANLGVQPVTVTITANGNTLGTVTANQDRPDLQSYLGSSGHGWSYSLSNLPDGVYTIQAYAQDAAPSTLPAGQPVLLGTRTVTVQHTPTGSLDQANQQMIFGWTLDPDTPQTPTYYRLDIDGVAGTPALADASRPDLASLGGTDHGFFVTTPALSVGYHRVDLWAFDTASGDATFIGSKTMMVNNTPIGHVDILTNNLIDGWAFDQDSGAGAVQVNIAIDQAPFAMVTADRPRADLTGYVGSPNHGFSLALPALPAGTHQITATAIDGQTGQTVVLQTATLSSGNDGGNHRPIGSLDIANAATAYGWLYDADAGAGSIAGELVIDGTTHVSIAANQTRSDLSGYLGSTDHGFGISLNLVNTRHLVQLYAFDQQLANTPTLIASFVIGPAPMAHFDLSSHGVLYGWAFLPNDYDQTAQVRIDVDNFIGPLVVANTPRPDLVSWIGSANHGFAIAAPPLSEGVHTLMFRVRDPLTDEFTIFATTQLTY